MSLRDGASILFERHAQALLGSLGRLARQPFATLLTVLVIGIALALPAALYLAVANMRVVTAGLDDTVQLSAYLAMSTTPAEAGRRAQSISELPGVAVAKAVSPDEGLAEGTIEQPVRAKWSRPWATRTITCLHGAVPPAWFAVPATGS